MSGPIGRQDFSFIVKEVPLLISEKPLQSGARGCTEGGYLSSTADGSY